ncbi:hypothetical protein [Streptomyces sp. NPDC097981]|uniref:hypothetical protein n=1 Tax=Streptomyces sp. NPDC097981 TaxID=3155428 RepID=UPI00331B721D
MNRHARYALLTPLLASSIALPPTMAAQASPVDRAPAALSAAPQAASCKLVVAPNTNPAEFDLVLDGFRGGALVKVTGPENFNRTVDQQGSFTEEDVKKGTYTVKVSQKKHNQLTVNCTKPPRVPATAKAHITDVDITGASTATAAVDCSKPQDVKFEGKLTGTGTGQVPVLWSSSQGKRSTPVVNFTAPTTAVPVFVTKSAARAKATDPAPRVTAFLEDTTTSSGANDSLTFTLTCT